MSKKTRWALFVGACIIFVVVSYAVVVYTLGYRYDFVAGTFVRTGSFRVVANASADVYISDVLVGTTSFINDSFSKGRLLPRSYVVRLQKTDYHLWQKNVPVYAGFFTDFPRVVLIQEKPEQSLVATSSFDRFTSVSFNAEDKYVIVQKDTKKERISLESGTKSETVQTPIPTKTKSNASPKPSPTPAITLSALSPDKNISAASNGYDITVAWINDSNFQPFNKRGESELIARYPIKVSDIQWYKDSNHLIIKTGAIIKFIEVDKRGGVNSYDIATTDYSFWYNRSDNVLYFFDGPALLRLRL